MGFSNLRLLRVNDKPESYAGTRAQLTGFYPRCKIDGVTRHFPHRCIVILCCLSLVGCAGFTRVFRGNTRKEFGAYDIEERQQYKHYLDNRAIQKREHDREIIRRLKTDPATESGGQGAEKKRKITKDSERVGRRIKKRESPPPAITGGRSAKREYSFPARIIRRLFRLEE